MKINFNISNLAMKKWLSRAVLLCTACVLQAHSSRSYSYQSAELEDALLQQGSHLNAKITKHFPSPNVTVLDEYEYDALAQLDQLSLVTRYAGLGYNIIRGNPEGDFNRGGIDPGIKTTREILTHTYKKGRKALYQGRAMEIPDQVSFYTSQSCASSHSIKAFSGRKSYMKELESSVSVEGMSNDKLGNSFLKIFFHLCR